jgi:hypothetical protein
MAASSSGMTAAAAVLGESRRRKAQARADGERQQATLLRDPVHKLTSHP